MPRVRKAQKKRRAPVDVQEWEIEYAMGRLEMEDAERYGLNPWMIFGLGFDYNGTATELWHRVKAKVVPAWKHTYPGTRPPLWWMVTAPETAVRRLHESETAILEEMGVLSDYEKEALKNAPQGDEPGVSAQRPAGDSKVTLNSTTPVGGADDTTPTKQPSETNGLP